MASDTSGKETPWEGRVVPANRDRPFGAAKDVAGAVRKPTGDRGKGSARDNGDDERQRAYLEEDTPAGYPRGGTLWAWWGVATTLGWTLAGLCIGLLVTEGNALQYAFLPLPAIGQWLILRRHFVRAGMWLVANVAATLVAALAYVVLLALPESLLGPVDSGMRQGLSGVADGLALGMAQWWVLRGSVRGAERWIFAAGAPLWLFFALPVLGFGTESVPLGPTVDMATRVLGFTTTLGTVGILSGALTGGVLAWLVDQPRLWEEVDDEE